MYYGLSLQVGDFGLDIYLTQLVFGVVEIPARLSSILMMEKLGRKRSQLGSLTLAGTMCIIVIFIPGGTRLFPIVFFSARASPIACTPFRTKGFPRAWCRG